MDSLQIVVVASPFANMTSLYEVDPDADVLLIVPPFNPSSFAPLPGSSSPSSSSATTPGLRLKVSSKHLALSSKPFRNKLQFKNSASSHLQSDGRTHISLSPGFDPKAVTIALNAVHGRGSKVPKQVDLETLAKIACFVDKFQLFETLEIYADRWISTLWKNVDLEDELTSQRDLVFWIYVAHVFKQAEIFKSATRQAALRASGPIDTLGLPIREKIISECRPPIPSRTLPSTSKCQTHD